MSGIYSSAPKPIEYEKTMVFIDGSNVFPNLREANIKFHSFYNLAVRASKRRMLVRTYVYTTQEKLDDARALHGAECFQDCRIVLGDSIPLPNGHHREKGVDALLVADLIYHAAMKNYQYAIVISNDSDFAVALKRVEDFGCRTGLVSVIKKAPQRLIDACDDFLFYEKERLLELRLASEG